MTGPAPPRRTGYIIAGLLFAGFGVAVLAGMVVTDLIDMARMRDWVAVRAELIDLDLERHHGRRATTFEVTARYRYHVAGTTFEGSRVGISPGPDNIGSYHEDWHARLRKLRRDKTPLTVWVDPADPADSVIDREPRWGFLLFKSLFGAIPLVIGGLLLSARVDNPR